MYSWANVWNDIPVGLGVGTTLAIQNFSEFHVIILLVFMEMIMGMVSLMGSVVVSEMQQCEYKH